MKFRLETLEAGLGAGTFLRARQTRLRRKIEDECEIGRNLAQSRRLQGADTFEAKAELWAMLTAAICVVG